MKKKFLFLLLFFTCICNSQTSGIIYNEQNSPIKDVSVFLLKNKDTLGTTLSNDKGFFEFKNISRGDIELVLSHISYETVKTKLVTENKYTLISKQHSIEEVTIVSRKKEKKHILNRIFNTVFYGSIHLSYDSELAVFIPATDKNKDKKIKNIKYQLTDLDGEMKNNKYEPFRACIYTVDTITKKPKEKIYRSEKVRMIKNEKWFYVNIDSLDIKIPKEGLFIVLETLNREESGNKQIQNGYGRGAYDVVPTVRTKLFDPRNQKKSYYRHNNSSKEENLWEFDETFHYCMEFEFEK